MSNQNDLWKGHYRTAQKKLFNGNIQEAFSEALSCQKILEDSYKTYEFQYRVFAINNLSDVIFLLKDCSVKNGCFNCAEKHLLNGKMILEKIFYDRKLEPMLRQNARKQLGVFSKEIFKFYSKKELEYELASAKASHKKNQSYLFLIKEEYDD